MRNQQPSFSDNFDTLNNDNLNDFFEQLSAERNHNYIQENYSDFYSSSKKTNFLLIGVIIAAVFLLIATITLFISKKHQKIIPKAVLDRPLVQQYSEPHSNASQSSKDINAPSTEPQKAIESVQKSTTSTNDPQPETLQKTDQNLVPQYVIQVAICSSTSCKRNFTNILREHHLHILTKVVGDDKITAVQLISKQKFSLQKIEKYIKLINKYGYKADKIKSYDNYQIVIEKISNLDLAEKIKLQIEELLSEHLITFFFQSVKKNQVTKIFAGPYDSSKQAEKVLQELKKNRLLKTAFITKFN